jgi:hypothetical protein
VLSSLTDDPWELSLQRAQFKINVESNEPVWTPARQELWRRLEQHDFEPDTALNFTRRLARDHGWSLEDARAAVDAYRRFCFLVIISPTPVTPSEVVDEVWHQHLIYSRDYWTNLVRRDAAGTSAPRPHARRPRGPNDLSPAICRNAGAARARLRAAGPGTLAGDASALRAPALSCDGPQPLVYHAQAHRMDSQSLQELN